MSDESLEQLASRNGQRWNDAVMEAHRRDVPITDVLAEYALEDARDRFIDLARLFGVDLARSQVLTELDLPEVAAMAERVLNAASAAEVLGTTAVILPLPE